MNEDKIMYTRVKDDDPRIKICMLLAQIADPTDDYAEVSFPSRGTLELMKFNLETGRFLLAED